MIESRNDFVLRILDDIALLAVRLTGLRALGLTDEIRKEFDRLEQAAAQLDAEARARVTEALNRVKVGPT